jgi:uncharacterized membrane protein
MSDAQDFDFTPIPKTKDGELDFDCIATVLLRTAQTSAAGVPFQAWGKLGGEAGAFEAVFDGLGGLKVTRATLATRFGASLFMALERQAKPLVGILEEPPEEGL